MRDPLAVLGPTLAKMDDLCARLAKIEAYKGPLWMQQPQGQATPASTSPSPAGIPPLAKAAGAPPVGLGAGSADAVLNALLADPATAGAVRMKIEQMRSFP
jgi:hypothetical protein